MTRSAVERCRLDVWQLSKLPAVLTTVVRRRLRIA